MINKSFYSLILCILLIGCTSKEEPSKDQNMTKAIPNKTITLNQLEEMFAEITESTDWDMTKPMLWGYFFTHHEPGKLESAKAILVERGYTFIDIDLSDKENPTDPDLWWLHVEKAEVHTPQSLDKRNNEFYLLADELGLDSYDGMDVGLIENINEL